MKTYDMGITRIEHTLANTLTGAFFVTLISGLLLYSGLLVSLGYAVEICLFTHLITAIYFLIFGSIYTFFHLKKTIKSRRNSTFFTGIIVLFLFFVCLYSGSNLLLLSRYSYEGSNIFTGNTHLATSLLFLAFISGHALFSRYNVTKQSKKIDHQINKSSFRATLIWSTISITISVLLILPLFQATTSSNNQLTISNQAYQYPYGDNPFEPSKTTTTNNQFIQHKFIGGSKKCSSCHSDIFEQWSRSAHRYAAADPSYVKNINLLEEKKGIESTRYCEGCHSPIALLSGQLTEGGKHGGTPGTMAFNEGISCLSCHRTVAINNTEGVGSFHFVATSNSPLIDATNIYSTQLANFLTTASPKKHKTLFNSNITSDPKSCASCHAQFMDKEMNDWGWVKMQDEYTAWLQSPFSGHGGEQFSTANIQTCQTCHMPLVHSNDPSAGKDGMIRSHNFAAANTVIPSFFGEREQLDDVINFLQSNKLRVTIEPPKGNKLVNHSSSISAAKLNHNEAPIQFYAGQSTQINIAISNINVGHAFPGGTTDIQEAWLHFQAVDSTGEIIYESGKESLASDSAAIYKTIPVDRHGKHVWKHDLFNVVGDTFKNVIPSGKSDIVVLEFHIPKHAKGPVSLHASLRYRKFTQAYEKWVFDGRSINIPEVEVARATITVPVRLEAPAS